MCCGFVEEPIRFRATTARFVATRSRREQRQFLAQLALDNLAALEAAVRWCGSHDVGAFRVMSQLFPLVTHPDVGYAVDELPRAAEIAAGLDRVRLAAKKLDVRLSFHPDQFIVPGSESAAVVESSLAELEHQADLARRIGAEQLTIHGGGARPDKAAALVRLARGLARLSAGARGLIALENDDRVYTVADLLPLCERDGLPLVYDVHHHRCNPDELSLEEATVRAAATWKKREPWVHLSSPLGGWRDRRPQSHADFIAPGDVPPFWIGRALTVDIEAKAKERAVLRLQGWVRARERGVTGRTSPGTAKAAR
ncbi:MAG: UV-damage endonuclease [Myxococcales bacterium]|nr:UV-damage endonuclease [Myxococcales bacterium]